LVGAARASSVVLMSDVADGRAAEYERGLVPRRLELDGTLEESGQRCQPPGKHIKDLPANGQCKARERMAQAGAVIRSLIESLLERVYAAEARAGSKESWLTESVRLTLRDSRRAHVNDLWCGTVTCSDDLDT
jgi:hypothetical protein